MGWGWKVTGLALRVPVVPVPSRGTSTVPESSVSSSVALLAPGVVGANCTRTWHWPPVSPTIAPLQLSPPRVNWPASGPVTATPDTVASVPLPLLNVTLTLWWLPSWMSWSEKVTAVGSGVSTDGAATADDAPKAGATASASIARRRRIAGPPDPAGAPRGVT